MSETDCRGARVLVVEDDSLVRRVVVRLLGIWGYETVEAADGHDAVERFRERKGGLDAVLLDVMLPGLNGVEVARAIRSEDSQLPIVICSAVLDFAIRSQLIGLNIQSCLDKPITADHLRKILTEVVQSGRHPEERTT